MILRRHQRFVLGIAVAVLAVPPASAAAQGFEKVPPAASGLDINIAGTGNEDWGYGAAFFDCDGDGDLDLYVANQGGVGDWLFRQNGDGTFTDIAVAAGCADVGNNRAVKFADFDNDGDEDFFLGTHRGPNHLFRNNGDGTFTDVANDDMRINNPTFGAAWGDFNADGHVDLYVVNRGTAVNLKPNQLFVNNGDGTFTDRAPELGVDDGLAGLEAVWIDYDNDGDVDLYLSNDKHAGNHLWRNNGDGTFTDVSVASGTDISIDSMGIGVGDYDGNGFTDIYLTNTAFAFTNPKGGNVLLGANGDGTFSSIAPQKGVVVNRYAWGCSFFDYDNDMDLDLYVVNWAIIASSDARNNMFRNNGDGTFTDVSVALGVADDSPGYGLAVADYNDDGFLDMFVSNNNAPSVLYRAIPTSANWLKVLTVGTQSNRDGIGARVVVTAGGREQFREVSGGESYLCHPSREVEFGLGTNTSARVEVRWPSGVIDRWDGVASKQTMVAIEGASNALIVSPVDALVETGGVRITWEVTRTAGVDGFHIYRRPAGGAETRVTAEMLSPGTRAYHDAGVDAGKVYQYAVAGVETAGGEVRSDWVEVLLPAGAPAHFAVMQNAPNPFNPQTTIRFELPAASAVRLAIYSADGALVRVLVDETLPAGAHDAIWTGRDAVGRDSASGVYFYRLESTFGVQTRRMVLLK